ncbi:hypothetical protein [Dyella kyungheensis]|uniref:Uncharacterized protein n=1 Tax=Dyella kyungheensis TaxID=1242174 RepID=A0ABS2JXX8_9GAMM|nr:hypothetical protein [Dyella kyungheensis]MBM7123665.1 hypothetical protein [Dyella kyungheensis]
MAPFALTAMATTAYGADSKLNDSHAVYQSISVGNHGVGAVHDVVIAYSGRAIPAGTIGRTMKPGPGYKVTESWALAIPEEVEIIWTSNDGQRHRVSAPLRSLVPHEDSFNGADFVFVDDHVDVYAESRKPTGSKFLDVEITKIYSSKIAR